MTLRFSSRPTKRMKHVPNTLMNIIIMTHIVLINIIHRHTRSNHTSRRTNNSLNIVIIVVITVVAITTTIGPRQNPTTVVRPSLTTIMIPNTTLPTIHAKRLTVRNSMTNTKRNTKLVTIITTLTNSRVVHAHILRQGRRRRKHNRRHAGGRSISSNEREGHISLAPALNAQT